MKDFFLKTHKKIKEWLTQVLFKKYLTPFALIVIYFTVVAATSVVAKIFFRKSLKNSSLLKDSNWIHVENYEGTLEESLKQS